jgi:transposase-like protein
MAVKKRRAKQARTPNVGHQGEDEAQSPRATRLRRTDEEKIALVRQVLASGNQSAELKRVGIYPNQFYDWKKKYAAQLGGRSESGSERRRGKTLDAARTIADEAKAFIEGKASLLERLRNQRSELDALITQLES